MSNKLNTLLAGTISPYLTDPHLRKESIGESATRKDKSPNPTKPTITILKNNVKE